MRLLRRAALWLWHQEGSHGQRARGLAAGVFCGCFPFFGLQTLLGIALASVVRGNHLLAAAGTWISNPFTYLPLYWFNFKLGSLLLGPGLGWPGLEVLRSEAIWQLGWSFVSRMLLGSLIVGCGGGGGPGLGLLALAGAQRCRPDAPGGDHGFVRPGNTIRSMWPPLGWRHSRNSAARALCSWGRHWSCRSWRR